MSELKVNKIPFFSIVVPTYNRAGFICKAIESVLIQTFNDFELIIVDDGSTDNTKEVIEKYNDSRIKYFYQKNKERSAARNEGIRKSKGEYITFLDSDDYYLPQRLENLYNGIISKGSPIAFFYTGISFEKDGVILEREEINNSFKSDKDFIVWGVIGTPQACLHRAIFDKHKFNENFHISEDMELWLRIIHDGYKLYFIDMYDIIAVQHSGRSIDEFSNNSFFEMAKVLRFMFSKNHPGNDVSSVFKRSTWGSVNYGIAKYNIYNNNKWKAIYYLIKSIIAKPFYPQTKHKIFLICKIMVTKKNRLFQLKELIG